jgi:uncharacterized protein with FMN-binding domain
MQNGYRQTNQNTNKPMNSSIKKYIIGGVIVVAFAAYVIFSGNRSDLAAAPSPLSPSDMTYSSSSPSSSTAQTAAGSDSGNGMYKNGTYTGTIADAFYGKLQAVAVIQGGRLADVQFPTYPSDGGHTLQLSNSDLPILKQEAIAAQSANVNVVSGATQTSQAFEQSLASALAQAK